MKDDDTWSIRKMRDRQKLSTTRNTYKSEDLGLNNQSSMVENEKGNEGMLDRFYQKLALFLEE